jgi:hypothetical protein
LKKKGFEEERMTTIGLDDLGTSTTLESNKSLAAIVAAGRSAYATRNADHVSSMVGMCGVSIAARGSSLWGTASYPQFLV